MRPDLRSLRKRLDKLDALDSGREPLSIEDLAAMNAEHDACEGWLHRHQMTAQAALDQLLAARGVTLDEALRRDIVGPAGRARVLADLVELAEWHAAYLASTQKIVDDWHEQQRRRGTEAA